MTDGPLFLPNPNRRPRDDAEHPNLNTGSRTTVSDFYNPFFEGHVRFALQERIGVPDVAIGDYLSTLLTRFIRTEGLFSQRDVIGHRLTDITSMMEEAEARQGPARRAMLRHIGDYGLFITGMFPDGIEYFKRQGSRDSLIDYHRTAPRAYYFASLIPPNKDDVSSDTLNKIADNFELCSYALAEVWSAFPDDSKQMLIPRTI